MIYPKINSTVLVSKESDLVIDTATGKNMELPSGAYPVLNLIDGDTELDTIINNILESYNTSYEDVYNFIMNLADHGFISFSPTSKLDYSHEKHPIRLASIEITEKCNLKCRYCYGAFAPDKTTFLSSNDASCLFAELKRRGVQTVELTGGEPTVNPYYDQILINACKNFKKVTVMTNAVILRQTTLEIYQKNKDKVGFSISLDGFSEETNSYQRGVEHTFKQTINNILLLKKEVDPYFFRIVYMLTNENQEELEAFYDFMISHNILDIMASIPENIEKGRTYKLSDGCMMSDRNSESRKALDEKIRLLGDKYGNQIRNGFHRLGDRGMRIVNAIPSCGAGWTMLSFRANGDVQPCNMMGVEWNLGNFKKDPSLSFLSTENPLYNAFTKINLSTENDNRKECLSCSYNRFCGRCINKLFMANKERLSRGEGFCPILLKTLIPRELFYQKNVGL